MFKAEARAGKLGALLANFPSSFKNEPRSHDHRAWLLDSLIEHPVAVELRHRSWSDDVQSTVTRLNRMGAAWVKIDEPKFRFSIARNYLPNVTSFYFMRCMVETRQSGGDMSERRNATTTSTRGPS